MQEDAAGNVTPDDIQALIDYTDMLAYLAMMRRVWVLQILQRQLKRGVRNVEMREAGRSPLESNKSEPS